MLCVLPGERWGNVRSTDTVTRSAERERASSKRSNQFIVYLFVFEDFFLLNSIAIEIQINTHIC